MIILAVKKLTEKTEDEIFELLNEAYSDSHDTLALVLELELLRRKLSVVKIEI